MENMCIKNFSVNQEKYYYIDINEIVDIRKLPYCKIVLYENYIFQKLTSSMGLKGLSDTIKCVQGTIPFKPHRILMQDYTAIPLLVDWLAFHERLLNARPGSPSLSFQPSLPIDIVIDHSLQTDKVGTSDSPKFNLELEYGRNQERFKFLKWVAERFDKINIIPPGYGICHQINLENLSKVMITKPFNKKLICMSENIIGTDSHTTMINGLSILGWGVGGLEAETVMLGEPILIHFPQVLGILLKGRLDDRVHITDVSLYLAEKLRGINVVGKFLEFFGEGAQDFSVPHRATLTNMTPEYGATCSYFPIDTQTLSFLKNIGKSSQHIKSIEKYAKCQGLWYQESQLKNYDDILEIDLSKLKPSMSGPKRPQDRINLSEVPNSFIQAFKSVEGSSSRNPINNGDIAIASITSCTNTSNPEVIFAAALLAKQAYEFGLVVPAHVKTSFAPGSVTVERYLRNSGLLEYMERLRFNVIGYGCATCSGNSGDLNHDIENEIIKKNLTVCSVLSGNRNFEGRIHRLVKANYLASPPLVIAYALMGSIYKNIESDVFGQFNGRNILLEDIWPSKEKITEYINKYFSKSIFISYKKNTNPNEKLWRDLKINHAETYKWEEDSTYIRKPPFIFQKENKESTIVNKARILLILGDSITTDHISPVGEIPLDSPAGQYLLSKNISQHDFNSLGARRGNYEIMMRAAFGNIRIKNEIKGVKPGPYTKVFSELEDIYIFNAASKYLKSNIPAVVFAGKEYGSGSSRDWAAKGPYLLGIKCIIAESFERIHRSNLIGMGIFPFKLVNPYIKSSLGLIGNESITIRLIDKLQPHARAECEIENNGNMKIIPLILDISNEYEGSILESGGIFNFCFEKELNKSLDSVVTRY